VLSAPAAHGELNFASSTNLVLVRIFSSMVDSLQDDNDVYYRV